MYSAVILHVSSKTDSLLGFFFFLFFASEMISIDRIENERRLREMKLLFVSFSLCVEVKCMLCESSCTFVPVCMCVCVHACAHFSFGCMCVVCTCLCVCVCTFVCLCITDLQQSVPAGGPSAEEAAAVRAAPLSHPQPPSPDPPAGDEKHTHP